MTEGPSCKATKTPLEGEEHIWKRTPPLAKKREAALNASGGRSFPQESSPGDQKKGEGPKACQKRSWM